VVGRWLREQPDDMNKVLTSVAALGAAATASLVAQPSAARTTQGLGRCAGHDQRRLPEHWQGRSARRIVFVDECDRDPFGALYVIRLDGSRLRRLRAGSEPAVSPNGREIAYSDGGIGAIAVIHTDGSHRRYLTNGVLNGVLDGSPAWSPDGRRLVFVRTVSPGSSGGLFASTIYVVNADGAGRRKLVGSAVDFPGPSWISERRILITARRGQLAIISATNGRTERLIRVPRKGTQSAPDAPALAPNHREIAYVECDNGDCSSTSVDLITLTGKLIERIPGAHAPSWTPQGKLLYACCQQAGIRGNTSEIVLDHAQHGQARTITPSSLSADQPAWLGGG
jgi:Tol biopolymer transport system component